MSIKHPSVLTVYLHDVKYLPVMFHILIAKQIFEENFTWAFKQTETLYSLSFIPKTLPRGNKNVGNYTRLSPEVLKYNYVKIKSYINKTYTTSIL
jgi:ABC-type microcin C transport system permease subunit YejE